MKQDEDFLVETTSLGYRKPLDKYTVLDSGRDDKNGHADQPSPSHGLQVLTQVLSLGTESELAYLS